MSALLIVLGVLLLLLVIIALVSGRRAPMPSSLSGAAHREASMAAQAEVEESDIEQMLQARDALRKRIGKPSLADELEADARRELED
jgi:hypothetical protein